jgi:S-adenosylmethionine:tRNA ribosyltransferase-isomerase
VKTSDFDFDLPPDRIAAAPAEARDGSRLMVMDRWTGARKYAYFRDLIRFLPPRCMVVLNDTRVIAARVRAHKPTGGAVEFLLTRSVSRAPRASGGVIEVWEALARGLGSAAAPAELVVSHWLTITVLERLGEGRVLVRLETQDAASVVELLDRVGEVPLPPYIASARRSAGATAPVIDDRARYQTVYARVPGAVAAPTAGLHFTAELLDATRAAGHETAAVTLHVGPGTFRPVKEDDPRRHRLDEERYFIPPATAQALAAARAERRPVIAVGTTVVRALEASARAHGGRVVAGEGVTDLCILPGDEFRVVTGLVTNFHLPRSTLLMLVAAFAGRERVLAAYRDAVARGFRFYSYGDAMLVMGDVGARPGAGA